MGNVASGVGDKVYVYGPDRRLISEHAVAEDGTVNPPASVPAGGTMLVGILEVAAPAGATVDHVQLAAPPVPLPFI